jgi:hypothetical protein
MNDMRRFCQSPPMRILSFPCSVCRDEINNAYDKTVNSKVEKPFVRSGYRDFYHDYGRNEQECNQRWDINY